MITNSKPEKKYIKVLSYGISIAIWIVIWHFAALYIGKEIFLPTPGRVFSVFLKDLLPSYQFRLSVITSLLHIGAGFLIGAITGIILAVLSSFSHIIKTFLWFPIKVLKSVPVASFVILALLWIDSENLSILIPSIIVLPTLYINTLTGITETDHKILEMADVFHISSIKRFLYIYIPNMLPYILSASSLAIGMAWKSGVAAEIIGLAKNSIGNELYKAKIYLMTPELFAWTTVIILLSMFCEFVIKSTAKAIANK